MLIHNFKISSIGNFNNIKNEFKNDKSFDLKNDDNNNSITVYYSVTNK